MIDLRRKQRPCCTRLFIFRPLQIRRSVRITFSRGQMSRRRRPNGSVSLELGFGLSSRLALCLGQMECTASSTFRPIHSFRRTKSVLERVDADDRQQAICWLGRAATEPQEDSLEFRVVLSDGSRRWLSGRSEVARGADGSLHAYGSAQDITEQKLREQALAARLQFTHLVFDAAPVGVIVYDEHGDCVAANPAAVAITGVDAQELIRENFRRVGAWNKSRLLALAEQCLSTNETVEDEVYVADRRARKPFWLACRLVPFANDHKPHLMALFTDITNEKTVEDENASHIRKLQSSLMQIVSVIRALSETQDPYTAGHERRVGEIAFAIGAELGLDPRQCEGLRIAGYLHDIGKMGAPPSILARPRRLTAAEFAVVKEHAAAGYEILKNADFPWPVATIALQHHERMDGSGYPQGLKGDEIAFEARVVAVADVIESMASHRPYRPALGIEAALEEIENGSGTLYDATVVDACLRLFRCKGYSLPE